MKPDGSFPPPYERYESVEFLAGTLKARWYLMSYTTCLSEIQGIEI